MSVARARDSQLIVAQSDGVSERTESVTVDLDRACFKVDTGFQYGHRRLRLGGGIASGTRDEERKREEEEAEDANSSLATRPVLP